MNTTRIKLITVICFLIVGLGLVIIGYGKTNEPVHYSMDDTSVTIIDISDKDKNLNLITLLGLALISLAAIITVYDYVSGAKDKPQRGVSTTRQEERIISYIKEGMTNKEIAIQLSISTSTVKTHINNIYKKFAINSREELLRMP